MKKPKAGVSGTLWGGKQPLDQRIDRYTAGDDRALDGRLLSWDILGSIAHVRGLESIEILDEDESLRLQDALRRALTAAARGDFIVGPGDEDVHSAVEKRLISEVGDLGRKVHTGRSRNDQVVVDLRLYVKDRLFAVEDRTLGLAGELLRLGERYEKTLLPGFTHQRRAMPSSVALWAAGFAEGLLDDLQTLDAALALVDRSPLGSAAGYGAPLALPRSKVAEELGFSGIQHAVTSVQSSRGKIETVVLQSLWTIAHDLGKLSWDVILFSSEEFALIDLPAELATGSSIMPHKRNPDIFELTRGRAGVMDGLVMQAMGVSGGLPSGYHRDLQLIKEPLMKGLDTTYEMLEMMHLAIPQLEFREATCEEKVCDELLATDEVFRRVRAGTPFRAAYTEVSEEIRDGRARFDFSAEEILATRTHEGGAGAPGLAVLQRDIDKRYARLETLRATFDAAIKRLAEGST